MTNQDNSGRVAVVVGAGSGLGQATALKLAALGMKVVAVDRNEQGLAALPPEYRPRERRRNRPNYRCPAVRTHRPRRGDARSTGQHRRRVRLGRRDDDNSRPLATHVGREPWTRPLAQSGGRSLHAASGIRLDRAHHLRPGLEPAPGMAAYAVSKAALVHLTRVLDLEFRPLGIRVNAVAPQLIKTAKNEAFLPADVMAHAVTPEAIAEVVAFLVSNAAAPVSGAILPAYGA